MKPGEPGPSASALAGFSTVSGPEQRGRWRQTGRYEIGK